MKKFFNSKRDLSAGSFEIFKNSCVEYFHKGNLPANFVDEDMLKDYMKNQYPLKQSPLVF
jgi:hypothetical protein